MIGLNENEVKLCTIKSENWEELFDTEKRILEKILNGYYITIEHIGSTAIPNICAKPIIDISVGVKEINIINKLIVLMENGGYILKKIHVDEKRYLFIKKKNGKIIYHIHIEEYGSASWLNHIKFRDILINNDRLRNEYMLLKIELQKKYFNNRLKYTKKKEAFIKKVLDKNKKFLIL